MLRVFLVKLLPLTFVVAKTRTTLRMIIERTCRVTFFPLITV